MNTHTHTFWLTSSGLSAVRDGACRIQEEIQGFQKKTTHESPKAKTV